MIIVDTHCHAGLNKYEPRRNPALPHGAIGVDRAVLIQHQGTTNNSYHVECLQAHPDQLTSAMIVENTDDGERMRYWG